MVQFSFYFTILVRTGSLDNILAFKKKQQQQPWEIFKRGKFSLFVHLFSCCNCRPSRVQSFNGFGRYSNCRDYLNMYSCRSILFCIVIAYISYLYATKNWSTSEVSERIVVTCISYVCLFLCLSLFLQIWLYHDQTSMLVSISDWLQIKLHLKYSKFFHAACCVQFFIHTVTHLSV